MVTKGVVYLARVSQLSVLAKKVSEERHDLVIGAYAGSECFEGI